MWRRCVDASGHGQREHDRDQLQVSSRTGEGNFSKESLPRHLPSSPLTMYYSPKCVVELGISL